MAEAPRDKRFASNRSRLEASIPGRRVWTAPEALDAISASLRTGAGWKPRSQEEVWTAPEVLHAKRIASNRSRLEASIPGRSLDCSRGPRCDKRIASNRSRLEACDPRKESGLLQRSSIAI